MPRCAGAATSDAAAAASDMVEILWRSAVFAPKRKNNSAQPQKLIFKTQWVSYPHTCVTSSPLGPSISITVGSRIEYLLFAVQCKVVHEYVPENEDELELHAGGICVA